MKKRNISLLHVSILACLFILAFSTYSAASQKDGLLKIYFLNVGQGDSMLIEGPNGNQVLIDGGPGNSVLSELAEVIPFYDKEIDAVIVSHYHADHITGLIEVLDRYNVHTVIESDGVYDSPVFQSWRKRVEEEEAKRVDALKGVQIDLGNGALLQILAPIEPWEGREIKDAHEASVVARLVYKDFEVMFPGDTEERLEKKLIDQGINLESDVLKVGHQGSNTSSSPEFLSTVRPKIGVIEVGKDNKYNHPSEKILSRLEQFGIKYYRTDIDGRIAVISDGHSFFVNH